MENRFQYFLLRVLRHIKSGGISLLLLGVLITLLPVAASAQNNTQANLSTIDNELFDIGIQVGLINIEDFGSEIVLGTSATFKASEDFFLQFNFLRTDADYSSYERSQGAYFDGADRNFEHYDLLLGYNLFQAEFLADSGAANLAALYVVGGVGNTSFGGEASFTYTAGVGYQVVFARTFVLRLDYRDLIYTSNLINENKTTHNGVITAGVSFLF